MQSIEEEKANNNEDEIKKNENENKFWKEIGNPVYCMAPMVDQSDLPFRLLSREYGTQLTYTPMLHSRFFHEQQKYRDTHFQVCPIDRPLIAQFCGDDSSNIIKSSKFLEGKVDAIDLNLGCPQGIARRGHYGAYLLQFPSLVMNMISEITKNTDIPLTCKIRKVSDEIQDTINFALQLESNGCAAICIHGRTKEEKCQMTRKCDWDSMKCLKQRLRIPVIANGGIETYEDALECLKYTGADAVMSAEGILDYPALFSGKMDVSKIALAYRYLELCKIHVVGIKCIKAHMFKMLHPFLQSNVDLRSELAHVNDINDIEDIINKLALRNKEEKFNKFERSQKWYWRHRLVSPIS